MNRIFSLAVASAVIGTTGFIAPSPVAAQGETANTTQKKLVFSQGILFPHSYLDAALAVSADDEGFVDYVPLKTDKNLGLYLQAVATADLAKFPVLKLPPKEDDKNKKWREDRNAELVFWINAYNAHILKAIADAYPVNSPDEIKDFDTAKTRVVAGENYSFRDMRKKIAGFDPRALFALTNGTKGGPRLAPRAYRFADINDTLELSAKNFVNDPQNVSLLRIQNEVTVNSYLTEFNDVFAPRSDPKRMEGVRFLLGSYTDQRGQRSYYVTSKNDYRIKTNKTDRTLNYRSKTSPSTSTSG
jgi:hypothetical protein